MVTILQLIPSLRNLILYTPNHKDIKSNSNNVTHRTNQSKFDDANWV